MDKRIARERLKRLYSELESLKFPDFTGQEELDEWLEDLIELDACYAGLASSVAEGAFCQSDQLTNLDPIEIKLKLILRSLSLENKTIRKIEEYLNKIVQIDQTLRDIAS